MEENYYMVSTPGVPLPLKWTAPEAMEKKTFSEKSDVWSFGVVLYEIFSHGSDPYLGWDPKLILKQLRDGERLMKPPECPPDVYAAMLRCWEFNRADRPGFTACYEALHAIQEGIASQSRRSGVAALSRSSAVGVDGDGYTDPGGATYLDASI
jgi:serine/threonine protein kinase